MTAGLYRNATSLEMVLMGEYGFIENFFCKRPILIAGSYETANRDLSAHLAQLQIELNGALREKESILESTAQSQQAKIKKIAELESQITELTNEIATLNQQINQNIQTDPQFSSNFSRLPLATQQVATSYMNKYSEGYVTYNGRTWGKDDNKYPLDVKAWLMQGQNDWEIVSKVRNAKARVSDVLQENPNLSFHQACDIAFMRVTNALGDSISYTYDQTTWGDKCAEYWQFASETRTIGRGDCEDKAVYNLVGCIVAGIPYELLRLVAGFTFTEEGHATHFYFASDLRWHHRNSTTNYSATKSVLTLPLPGDSSENLNISRVWFSATQSKTFTTFDPSTATTKEKKDGILKYLKWR